MPGIFSQIIAGQIPCFKIAENETCFAFLDVFPLAPGHTLVVPKIEVDNIHDLDAETHAALFAFAKQVAHAIGKAIPCKKVGMAVVGLEVPQGQNPWFFVLKMFFGAVGGGVVCSELLSGRSMLAVLWSSAILVARF